MSAQIFDNIDISVNFHGLRLKKDDLLPGILISGSSGSGKTVTAVNEIASQIAMHRSDEAERKPAIIYFVAKGQPQMDFIDRLPPRRKKDVVTVSLDSDSTHYLELIPVRYWADHRTAGEAAVQLLIEHQRHMSHSSDAEGNHKAFWDGQRTSILSTLAKLVCSPDGYIDTKLKMVNAPSAVISLAVRVSEFVKFLQQLSRDKVAPPSLFGPAFDSAGIKNRAALAEWLDTAVEKMRQSPSLDPERIALIELVARNLREADLRSPEAQEKKALLERFYCYLSEDDKRTLKALVDLHALSVEAMRYSTFSELEALVTPFLSSRAYGGAGKPVSFEEVMEEGKILIVDYPLAGTGGGSRSQMIAAALGFFAAAAARLRLRGKKKNMNALRPVFLVMDEFHLSVSRGRDEGLAKFVSICREFGVGCILAAQNLHLVSNSMGGDHELAALAGNLNTHLYFSNSCSWTNEWASRSCGESVAAGPPLAMNFDGNPELDPLLEGAGSGAERIIEGKQFSALRRGQFVARQNSGAVCRVDARREIQKPIVTLLGSRLGKE
ncbi:MAG: type IV secretion system DNA-binding domain-containing protein [Terrimicrobiaceae bacterium]